MCQRGWIILIGLLGVLPGCQLFHSDGLAGMSTASTTPGTPKKSELPAAATSQVCLATAEELERGGKETEALALYEKARQTNPQLQLSRRLAVLYDRQGYFDEAVREYQQAIQQHPKDADLLNDLGFCCYTHGRWEDAEMYLQQALAINPKHAKAWTNLGLVLGFQKRYEESMEAFTKVIGEPQAICNLAFILTTQGKLEEAKKAYRQALRMEPDLALAKVALDKLEGKGPRSNQNRNPATLTRATDARRIEAETASESSEAEERPSRKDADHSVARRESR